MALTLISLITLASTAIAAPVPACVQTIISVADDTCDSIGTQFGVTGADILAANSFLDCDNIWVNTSICVPPTTNQPSPTNPSCSSTYVVPTIGETCESIGSKFGVSDAQIKASNDFLDCEYIWQWTNICIPFPSINLPDSNCASTYVVPTTGETCDSLGTKFGVSAAQILSSNSFLNCEDVWQWTQICVPSAIPSVPSCANPYVVLTTGETCDSIGTKFGVSGADIKSSNNFLTCDDIWQWTNICVPSPSTTPSPSSSTTPPAPSSSTIPSGPTCVNTYVVISTGETCSSIAAQYGISETEVVTANPTLNCNDIEAGASICITASQGSEGNEENNESEGDEGSEGSGNNEINAGGFATWFLQNGNAGACGDFHQDAELIAAIDHRRYGDNFGVRSDQCGKQVVVTNNNNGKTVTVTIVDVCPTCANQNSIDLSTGAFKALADLGDGMIPISWSYV